MSNQEDKEKRSRRLQKEENAIQKQIKIAKTKGMEVKQNEAHRFAKHHAMDCGNPECPVCGNPRKISKDKLTKQEKSFYQKEIWEESD
jgi:protein subunit release factor B